MQYVSFGFPEAVLEAGARQEVRAKVGLFRAQKLVFAGFMREIRGHFKIRHTRRPLLDREHVTAHSTLSRYAKRRRTVFEYHKPGEPSFRRTYLPSTVQYLPVDPLVYVLLKQVSCDRSPQMPSSSGVNAAVFGAASFGTGLSLATARDEVVLLFENRGDVQVRVWSTVFGISP